MKIVKKFFTTVFIIFFIAVFIYIFFVIYVIAYSKKNYQGTADAVLVLGAAQWNGRPSPILKERINHALKFIETRKTNYIIFTGGYGKNSPFAESIVSRDYSIKKGVSSDSILYENISNSTIENIYYAKKIFIKGNVKLVILVSDPMHMLRCKIIAYYFKINALSSPTQTSKFQSFKYKLRFASYEAYYILKFLFSAYVLNADVLR